jgi:hypothetical protein
MDDMNQIGGIGLVTGLCNALGSILKGIPNFPDWMIPVALPIAGAVGLSLLQGATPKNAVEGFLCGSAAVGLNQAVRHVRARE